MTNFRWYSTSYSFKHYFYKWFCHLQEKEEAGHRLARETDKLVNGDFSDIQDTQQKITQLQTNLQLFKQRVEDRRKLLTDTIAFYKNNRKVSDDLIITTFGLEYKIDYEYGFQISNQSCSQNPHSSMLLSCREEGSRNKIGVRCVN